MTKSEIAAAVKWAEQGRWEMDQVCQLAGQIREAQARRGKVYAQLSQVGQLIRYQALQLNGQFDLVELNEIIEWIRGTVVVVGLGESARDARERLDPIYAAIR